MVQTVSVTGAIMVTTPQEVAVIDAVKAMNMFLLPNVNVPILECRKYEFGFHC
ncbi:MAG: P-loop NTPase [Saprospiraceae bacterium]|nr:P-loop NTPase [Saprospiraceae bacterium]